MAIFRNGCRRAALARRRRMVKLKKTFRISGLKFLFKVEASDDPADYAKYERLRNDIWGFPEDNLPGTRNLMCENIFFDGSSLFIAIYREAGPGGFVEDDEHLIGFAYGFVGVKDKMVVFRRPDNLQFYAQYTAVRDEYRGYGLGVRLKEFQRGLVRDWFGLGTITCTFDPLTGVNAARNIHHFGMDVIDYKVATYGEFGGYLNRVDVPSDRLLMSWDLSKPPRKPGRAGGESAFSPPQALIRVREVTVAGRSGTLALERVDGLNPDGGGGRLAVPIPGDYYRMLRETDVDEPDVRRIPIDWRLATRMLFQRLFQKGYRVEDFVRPEDTREKAYYVFVKDKPKRPLKSPRRPS